MLEEVKQLHKTSHRHWHYLKKRRKYFKPVSAKQIIAGQIFTVVVSIIGGLFLESYKLQVIAFGGALLLYPGLIDLSASMAGALGAKLNHHLSATPFRKHSILVHDIGFALFVTFFASMIIGVVAASIGSLFLDNVDPTKLVLLAISCALLVAVCVYPLIASLVLILRKLKLNPDNLVGPIESSIVDVVATIILIVMIGVIS